MIISKNYGDLLSMKKEKKILSVLIILVFIFNTILVLNKIIKNKNMTVFQKLDDAHISIIAPIMEKNIQSKQMTKSSSNNKIYKVSFYKAKHRKIDYAIAYAKYKNEVNLKSGLELIIKTLKYCDNFTYKTKNNEITGNKGVLLEGSYKKNRIKYAIKEQLIKKTNNLWQIIIVFPYSKKNDIVAKNYVNSINILST
ncbi:MAG: hypothetical protein Nk1A_1550 [Endomicrobiia bacterium]|nr:MAG: hypothetical protein Nk1A_1550 [Endomicrobiia bacterium]